MVAVPLIDQRILIDAPPEVVWQVISDQSQVAQWDAGCSSVSVLTTQQRGKGVRRRCTLASGKDAIEEIVSWVEGMGYEYQRVEGGPYREYRGRLRLQLGPDGTSVQWTITYTPKGLLGRLRDRFGGQRALSAMVSASLRQLRRQVDTLGQRMDDEARARAAIRERLSADERAAAYAARQTPDEEGPGAAAPPVPAEPSFVRELAAEEPPIDPTADTQPQASQPAAASESDREQATPPDAAQIAEGIPLHRRVTPAHGTPSVQPSSNVIERPAPHEAEPPIPPPAEIKPPAPDIPPPPEIKPPAPAAPEEIDPHAHFRRPGEAEGQLAATPPEGVRSVEPARESTASLPEPEPRPGLPPQTPITDTGEISIWDVFGIRRPSEQDADALDDLIHLIQARHMAEQRLQGRFGRRSARVRFREGVLGLRLQLALQASQVRLGKRVRARIAREG